MKFVIPANTHLDLVFDQLVPWLKQNAVDPTTIDPNHPVTITDGGIEATTYYGSILAPVRFPMPDGLPGKMEAAGFAPTDAATVPLDHAAALIDQLQRARAAEKEAKERADEARSQLIALLEQQQAEYGTVAGRPAIRRNLIEKTQFQTAKFRAAHPELAEKFTSTRVETRLELL